MLGNCHRDIRDSRVPFFNQKTLAFNKIIDSNFVEIELPSLIMFCTEGWVFHSHSLFIFLTYIGVEGQTAYAVCSIISSTLFMISQGLSETTSTLVSNAIGDQDPNKAIKKARRIASLLQIATILTIGVVLAPLFIFINEIGGFLAADANL